MKKIFLFTIIISIFICSSITVYTESTSNSNSIVDITQKIYNYSSGSAVSLSITNISDKIIENWSLEASLENDTTILQGWSAKYEQNGQSLIINPENWNNKLEINQTIQIGFILNKPTDELSIKLTNPSQENPVQGGPTDEQKRLILTEGNNKFSLDLFKELNNSNKGKNLFCSPLSASIALSLTAQGAEGDTYDSILKGLNHLALDNMGNINDTYKSFFADLNKQNDFVTLNTGNSIWIKEQLKIKEDFINTGKDIFDADIFNIDFLSPQAPDKINGWVSDKTNGLIDRLVSEGDMTPDLAMLLINTIYFNGKWTTPFNPDYTNTSTFTNSLNESKSVEMMYIDDYFNYCSTDEYQAIKIPYGDDENVYLCCILPQKNLQLDDFINTLDIEKLNTIKDNLKNKPKVKLYLPKFKMEYGAESFKPALKSIGFEKLFTDNFPKITENLSISDVMQKAVIDINEEGTEAAAATAVFATTSIVLDENIFKANRPFAFFIYDESLNSILFIGKASNLGK